MSSLIIRERPTIHPPSGRMSSPTSSGITDLPPEVLGEVIRLASTDGTGSTPAALRLVSKYVSATAEVYRFYYVVVEGVDRIEALLLSVQGASDVSKRNCRSLSIADVSEDVRRRLKEQNDSNDLAQNENLHSDGQEDRTKRAVVELLRIVSPNLETLTLRIYNDCTKPYDWFASSSFPRLHQIHLELLYAGIIMNPPHPVSLPNLSDVHLSFAHGNRIFRAIAAFLNNIQSTSLACVRLSGIQQTPNNVKGVGIMVGRDDERKPRWADLLVLPPTVHQLIIEPVSVVWCRSPDDGSFGQDQPGIHSATVPNGCEVYAKYTFPKLAHDIQEEACPKLIVLPAVEWECYDCDMRGRWY